MLPETKIEPHLHMVLDPHILLIPQVVPREPNRRQVEKGGELFCW